LFRPTPFNDQAAPRRFGKSGKLFERSEFLPEVSKCPGAAETMIEAELAFSQPAMPREWIPQ
jgi:hypothetical protein